MRTLTRHSLTAMMTVSLLMIAGPAKPVLGFDPKDLPPGLHSVSVKGIPFTYRDQGQGDPLVILSPYPLSTELWAEMANRLSATARVIVVEPPGLRDPSSMGGDFSTVHLLEIYRDLVKALGFGEVHIMGVGEAGALAVSFAHHWPELTASAISINGFEGASWTEKFEKTLNYFRQSTDEDGRRRLLTTGSVRYRSQPPSPEELDRFFVPLEEEQRNAVHARFQAYTSDTKIGIVLMMLPNVNRPVLLIRSQDDEILMEEYIERIRGQIRKAPIKYQVISTAGHFAFLDQPEEVAEAIRAFLSEHSISKGAPSLQ